MITERERQFLARETCPLCRGTGIKVDSELLCNCVLRRIFDRCLTAYMDHLIAGPGPVKVEGPLLASRPNEEYAADFEMLIRRTLNRWQQQMLRRRISCPNLDSSMGMCMIKIKVGLAIVAQEPYSLYPPGEYIQRPVRTEHSTYTEREARRPQ